MQFLPVETERLVLRRFAPIDFNACVAYHGTDEVC